MISSSNDETATTASSPISSTTLSSPVAVDDSINTNIVIGMDNRETLNTSEIDPSIGFDMIDNPSLSHSSKVHPKQQQEHQRTHDSTSSLFYGKSLSSNLTNLNRDLIKIRTCFGILELSWLKITSFMALLFSLVAFVLLVVIIAVNYGVVTNRLSTLALLQTDTTYYRELMKTTCRIAVSSEYNRTLSLEYVAKYHEYYKGYYGIIDELIAIVPPKVLYWNINNISREDIRSRRAVKTEVAILDMIVMNGNYTLARQTLDSDAYKKLLEGYGEEVQSILDYVLQLKTENSEVDLATITNLLW